MRREVSICSCSIQLLQRAGTAPGQDLNLSTDRIKATHGFVNKVWNAGKFVLMACEACDEDARAGLAQADFSAPEASAQLPLSERWIIGALHQVIAWRLACSAEIAPYVRQAQRVSMPAAGLRGRHKPALCGCICRVSTQPTGMAHRVYRCWICRLQNLGPADPQTCRPHLVELICTCHAMHSVKHRLVSLLVFMAVSK